jgi:hypothetical protein
MSALATESYGPARGGHAEQMYARAAVGSCETEVSGIKAWRVA